MIDCKQFLQDYVKTYIGDSIGNIVPVIIGIEGSNFAGDQTTVFVNNKYLYCGYYTLNNIQNNTNDVQIGAFEAYDDSMGLLILTNKGVIARICSDNGNPFTSHDNNVFIIGTDLVFTPNTNSGGNYHSFVGYKLQVK